MRVDRSMYLGASRSVQLRDVDAPSAGVSRQASMPNAHFGQREHQLAGGTASGAHDTEVGRPA
jgi:hypothetical protein